MIKKREQTHLGISPEKTNKKSCLNCAYLNLKEPAYNEDTNIYVWYGEIADCYRKTWERVHPSALKERLSNSDDVERGFGFLGDDGPMDISALKSALEGEYGWTYIPTPDGKYIELATYKCACFYPKNKLNQRALDACWRDQQEAKASRDGWIKFWVPISMSAFALAISAISLWRTWG